MFFTKSDLIIVSLVLARTIRQVSKDHLLYIRALYIQ